MSVASDNISYRKGLLLGMTMAEIVILIIFLLLLAFATILDREQKAHAAEKRLVEKNKSLIEKIIQIADRSDPAITEELVRAIEGLPNIIQLINKNDLKKEGEDGIDKTLLAMVENEVAKKSVEADTHGKTVDERLAEALQSQKELETENQNLRDQKDNLVSQMKSEGRGVDSPPCWSDTFKNPEYIYKVDLTSRGIIVHDNPLPDRNDEKAKLPIRGVALDTLLTIPQFRAQTAPLFQLSQQMKCRFFVLLYDRTGITEKEIYKRYKQAVEDHFYKKEVNTRGPAQEIPHENPRSKSIFDFFKQNRASKEKYN
jgi:hypothetical protein